MKANKPYIVGLTGGIASGKSNVARTLAGIGLPVIDADAVSRSLTARGGAALPALHERFGEEIFLPDGSLDRRGLGALVFADSQALSDLNAIMHPLIFKDIQKQLMGLSRYSVVVLEIPLLFETGADADCDEVWATYVPRAEQVRRLMQRNRLTEAEAQARIASQMPGEEKAQRAHHVINTSGTYQNTEQQVKTLWEDLKRRRNIV